MSEWFERTVFYQIYPIGFCDAPKSNDGVLQNRIERVCAWIPHMKKLNVGAVLFNPVFESDAHGYDSRDLAKIDVRLGTNEVFADVCRQLHSQGIRVVLDGVFNHVGRGFWAFRDVQQNRESSPYKDWFCIDFGGNSGYNDGFWYEGWEGHYELVKLNLHNPQVTAYLFECVKGWIEQFDIDGIRLDVAYCLPEDFMRALRGHVNGLKREFFLVGEVLHGDYKRYANPQMLHSVTNYECYKGLYSSFNSLNMFEIAHSLSRQFGPEDWTLYKGLPLLNFADNHDVSRLSSILSCPEHVLPAYGVLFGMPGIPCLYYGSEWGEVGDKKQGDDALRRAFEAPIENEQCEVIAKMAALRQNEPALQQGDYTQVYLTNKQFIFQRRVQGSRFLIAVNADSQVHTAHFDARSGVAVERLSGGKVDFGGGYEMSPYCVHFLEMEHS